MKIAKGIVRFALAVLVLLVAPGAGAGDTGSGSLSTGTPTGTQAPAPLDCSIESHPDCPPKPTGHAGGVRQEQLNNKYPENMNHEAPAQRKLGAMPTGQAPSPEKRPKAGSPRRPN